MEVLYNSMYLRRGDIDRARLGQSGGIKYICFREIRQRPNPFAYLDPLRELGKISNSSRARKSTGRWRAGVFITVNKWEY